MGVIVVVGPHAGRWPVLFCQKPFLLRARDHTTRLDLVSLAYNVERVQWIDGSE